MKTLEQRMMLDRYYPGDQIQINLTDSPDSNGISAIVAGQIVIPDLSLVDVHLTRNVAGFREGMAANRIGFATNPFDHINDKKLDNTASQRSLVLAAEFAFYFAEDLIPDTNRALWAPKDAIVNTGLHIGSVLVNDTVALGSLNTGGVTRS